MKEQQYSEQEQIRRQKLSALREGCWLFPNDVRVDETAQGLKSRIDEIEKLNPEERPRCTLAGRLLSVRLMGKAAFCHLQDASAQIQLYLRSNEIGEESFQVFKTFDLGDLIEARGYGFRTKTGEPTLLVEGVRLLVKCLHPLPEKWHGLSDVELRYRRRYLDLIVSPEVRSTFIKRARIIKGVREFFDRRGFVEVETPILSQVASGAEARPFVTHHNALGLELHLRIAMELPLKKLLVGGLERVYELGRVFRNEGISRQHNPEFTMIEFYQAYETCETFIRLTEELIVSLADEVLGSRNVEIEGKRISLEPPWKRLTMKEAIYEIGGISRETDLDTLEGVHAAARALGLDEVCEIADYGKALFEVFDRRVEERIVDPVFVTRHPKSISPLARTSEDDPRFVDRFELIVNGMELANAFSELNDAEDQRSRFEEQLEARRRGDEEAMSSDEDFLRALEYGMPPAAGEGIGIDRLVMLLTGESSIRDVILFPTMRPQEGSNG